MQNCPELTEKINGYDFPVFVITGNARLPY
jgi:hypothetical protein